MSDFLKIINDAHVPSEKTILVFGCARGGTSAVSGALRELGVQMPHAHPLKHEWSPLKYNSDALDHDATLHTFEQMNRQYGVWGWKSPKDAFSLEKYQAHLRNPFILIVMRNLLDTSVSAERYEKISWDLVFQDNAIVQSQLAHLISFSTLAIGVVSYEKVLSNPADIVREINNWLKITSSPEKIDAAVRFLSGEPCYKALAESSHDGVISNEELSSDSAKTRWSIYNRRIVELERTSKLLSQDCELAGRIEGELIDRIQHLVETRTALFKPLFPGMVRHLGAVDRERFLETFLKPEVDRNRSASDDMDKQDDDNDLPAEASEVNLEILRRLYIKIRASYNDIVNKRIALQQRIDLLARNFKTLDSHLETIARSDAG